MNPPQTSLNQIFAPLAQQSGAPNNSLSGIAARTMSTSFGTPPPSQASKPIFSRIGGDVSSDVSQAGAELHNTSESPVTAGLNATGDVFNAISQPLDEISRSLLGKPISEITGGKADSLFTLLGLGIKGLGSLGADALGTKGQEAIASFAAAHPEQFAKISNTLGGAQSLGGIAGNILAAKGATDTTPQVAGAAKDVAGEVTSPLRQAITPMDNSVTKSLSDMVKSGNPEDVAAKVKGLFDTARTSMSDVNAPSLSESVGGDVLGKAMKSLSDNLNEKGKAVGESLKAVADKPVDIESAKNVFQDKLKNVLGVTSDPLFNQFKGKTFEESVAQLEKGIDQSVGEGVGKTPFNELPGRSSLIKSSGTDQKLLGRVHIMLDKLGDGKNSAQEVSDAIDGIQSDIYKAQKGAVPINNKVQGVVKSVVGELNNSLKKVAGDDFVKANSDYSSARQLRDNFSQKLGAPIKETGTFENASSLLRQASGDSATKALLRGVQQSTGVPIMDESNLSNFVEKALKVPGINKIAQDSATAAISRFGMVRVFRDLMSAIQDPEGKALSKIEGATALDKALKSSKDVVSTLKNLGYSSRQGVALMLLGNLTGEKAK